jgi:hypothetical protein
VTGTDTVREFQTLTIAYADGVIRSTGQVCNGTAAVPACVVGTANVDATGAWTFDQVGTRGGAKDPTDTTFWSTAAAQHPHVLEQPGPGWRAEHQHRHQVSLPQGKPEGGAQAPPFSLRPCSAGSTLRLVGAGGRWCRPRRGA